MACRRSRSVKKAKADPLPARNSGQPMIRRGNTGNRISNEESTSPRPLASPVSSLHSPSVPREAPSPPTRTDPPRLSPPHLASRKTSCPPSLSAWPASPSAPADTAESSHQFIVKQGLHVRDCAEATGGRGRKAEPRPNPGCRSWLRMRVPARSRVLRRPMTP